MSTTSEHAAVPVVRGDLPLSVGDAHVERRHLFELGDLAFFCFPALPLRAWFGVARLQGWLRYVRDARGRRTVRENLATILGPAVGPRTLERLTRTFFEGDRLRNLFLLLAPRLSAAQLSAHFRLEGLEHLESALQQRRGAVLLLSHLNSVGGFLAVMLLRKRGYDVRVALPTPRDRFRATRLRRWLDRRLGTQSFHALTGAFFAQFNVRPIVKLLRANSVVAFTGDGVHAASFVPATFLGRSIPFPTGAMSIAQLTGAPVLPLYVLGSAPNGLRLVIEAPFTVGATGAESESIQARISAYASRLEQHVRENPAAWQHCRIERALDTLEGWTERPLHERYAL